MATELLVAVFPSRSVLTKALDHLMSVRDLTIKRAAIVAKATTGETIVIGDDISADEAGIAGGTLGAAMTALGLAQLGALAERLRKELTPYRAQMVERLKDASTGKGLI